MEKHPLVRTIYLYIFALLGLALMTIGAVRFVDMGLKAFVFTKADQERYLYEKQPPTAPLAEEKINAIKSGKETTVSEAEKAALAQWLVDYNNFKDYSEKVDPLTSQRHRDASINIALFFVGLPLYIYHWRLIKKETPKS